MASTLPAKPPAGLPTFSSRSGLGVTMPPSPPGGKLRYGAYCFKATCQVYRDDEPEGCPIARVVGYDKSATVGKDTEYVCSAHVRTAMPGERVRCSKAEVVLLAGNPKLECSGQVFFEMDGATKKIV